MQLFYDSYDTKLAAQSFTDEERKVIMDSIKEFTAVNGKNRHNISLLASEAEQINLRIDGLQKSTKETNNTVDRTIESQ